MMKMIILYFSTLIVFLAVDVVGIRFLIRPIFERSTIVLAKTRQRLGPLKTLIGVGGVDSGETALAKIEAGADLVQLYTGMIYKGPGIANDIRRELSAALDKSGTAAITNLRDAKMKDWAQKPIPA